MDGFEIRLCKITGVDHSPLPYLLQEDPVIPIATENLLPGKCYSVSHGSFCEELVFHKLHLSLCVETNKVALYDLLYSALEVGPLESALQPHEKTKDGMKVIKAMYTQHGGTQK